MYFARWQEDSVSGPMRWSSRKGGANIVVDTRRYLIGATTRRCCTRRLHHGDFAERDWGRHDDNHSRAAARPPAWGALSASLSKRSHFFGVCSPRSSQAQEPSESSTSMYSAGAARRQSNRLPRPHVRNTKRFFVGARACGSHRRYNVH